MFILILLILSAVCFACAAFNLIASARFNVLAMGLLLFIIAELVRVWP